MFNRSSMIGALVAASAMSLGGPMVIRHEPEMPSDELRVTPKRQTVSAQAPARYKRSKGAQAKPKRKPNRLHVSKRVRRKHRRAA